MSFSLSCVCGTNRVQETDGSFFESYTAVSWKLENRRLMRMQEVGGEESPPPSLQTAGVRPPPRLVLHPKEVSKTFLFAAETSNLESYFQYQLKIFKTFWMKCFVFADGTAVRGSVVHNHEQSGRVQQPILSGRPVRVRTTGVRRQPGTASTVFGHRH